MTRKRILICAAIILSPAAMAVQEMVLPTQTGGFVQRGALLESVTHVVNTPGVQVYSEYDDENGYLSGDLRIEMPLAVPQFDGALGELVAINVTLDTFAETEFTVEAIGILNPSLTHEAVFYSNDVLFSGGAGYPVFGLLQRPSGDNRGIAPGFYPLGSMGVGCFGFPADEEACGDYDYTDASAGDTVDIFIFEDGNGPIYTLADWIGTGFVPNFTIFVDNPYPNNATTEYFSFELDNVAGAFGTIYTEAYSGTVTVEYVYEVSVPDADGDGVPDSADNCSQLANAGQVDTNADGFGNACDPDLNNDGIVNSSDLALFRAAFFSTGVSDSDFNADGITNALDLATMKNFFFMPPGPSGLNP